jgi:hypothetical protein
MHWYRAVTGAQLSASPARRRRPKYWQAGIHYYAGAMVGVATGPRRRARIAEVLRAVAEPRVGSFFDWRDPLPALYNVPRALRHPRALVATYLKHRHEVELER